MHSIPVYEYEIKDGVAEAIQKSNSLAYACEIKPWDTEAARAEAAVALKRLFPETAKASFNDFDLHFLQTILVTTGWNRNDDVFDKLETWVARHTPEHKPFNYEHDCSQVIGHIISNWVFDEQGKVIAEDASVDTLPAKFHIGTGAVLYKRWDKKELQERMDSVLAEISAGKWHVSMECLFSGFDYALKASDGTTRLVTRNENTAYLTKHLRVYGGTGNYGEYKVGRLLRNIVFSGKGLVRNPANPESVILPESETFAVASTNISQVLTDEVYKSVEQSKSESKSIMAGELEALQKELNTLKAENEQLKAAAHENGVKELKTKLEKVEQEKSKSDELLKAANTALESATATIETLKTEKAGVEQKRDELHAALEQVKAEQTKANRISIVKSKLNFSNDDANAFVENNVALAEEAFTKQVDLIAKSIAATAPKQTPAPLPAQQTPASVPSPAKAADLTTAEVQKTEAAALTVQAEEGVNKVREHIAEYFSAKK